VKFSITVFVPEILKEHPETRFTARELAQAIMQRHPDAVEDKRQRSRAQKVPLETHTAMIQQIVAEIGAQRKSLQLKEPRIRSTEGRPRRFYYSTKSEEDEVLQNRLDVAVQITRDNGDSGDLVPRRIFEADLYPLLTEYLKTELGVFSKRVDERRSTNNRGKGGNKWLYPDLVGVEDLSAAWDREIIDCAREYSDKKTKLWSFEVKLLLNSSNVREAYFQAVSNSSWANLGYLVAAEIEGSETDDELRMLSGLHGIGVVKLDTSNVAESQILIPARGRADVDWVTMDRLLKQNTDFREYIRLVRQFYQTGDLRVNDWDGGSKVV
jgi:hypothetical protein